MKYKGSEMMLKQTKFFLIATLLVVGACASLKALTPAETVQANKTAAAMAAVTAATNAAITTTNIISNAGTYVYSDAIALITPMADTISNPIWASLRLVPDLRSGYLDALLGLASVLVDNRERATPTDMTALRDAFDANISSDDFVVSLTSPFKTSQAQIDILTAAAKTLAKPVVVKQDFKSVISLLLTKTASAQAIDLTVFSTIADLIARRLDDDEVVAVVRANGSTVQSFEFQTQNVGVNFFGAENTAVSPSISAINLFSDALSYENSWSNLRSVIEQICGKPLYRNYTDVIDLTAKGDKTFNGTAVYRAEMLGRLVAPLTMKEIADCIDRMSSADPFLKDDVIRFMNRIKMLRTFLAKSLVKPTNEASKLIRQRLNFVVQSKFNESNTADASTTVAACRAEVQALLDALGSESYNDQIPEAGTVVALEWKNPATGLIQYLAATRVVSAVGASGQSTTWTFSADCVDYLDDRALFYSISSADKIGFQSLVADPGFVRMDDVAKASPIPTGIVGFESFRNPSNNLGNAILKFKNSALMQFFMQGTKESASFKNAFYVQGVAQQSGFLSVGADGLVRTFNAATKSPSGLMVDGVLTPGPWETFTMVVVDQFFVDLAKARNYSDQSSRLDFWKEAIKQSATDASSTSSLKRLAVVKELLRYVQDLALKSKPQRLAGLNDAVSQKCLGVIDFAERMFSGVVLKESDLRLALSKARAEAEVSVDLAPIPLGLPADGQSVVIFIPSLAGSVSGRYLQIVQESLDPANPVYTIRATAEDPVSPTSQFKVSVFRDCVSFESIAFPGNVFRVGVADGSMKDFAEEARSNKLRLMATSLAKDNRGAATGFWEEANRDARLQVYDVDGKEYLKCSANGGFLRVDGDGFVRTYTNSSKENPSLISSTSGATAFQLISLKDLYVQLGKLQSEADDLVRLRGYQNLINRIETSDDIKVLVHEVGEFFDAKRADKKSWNAFDQNANVKTATLNLLKLFRSSFKKALANKALDNYLSDVEEKFAIPPVFATQTALVDGQIVALGWKNDAGVTQYVSAKQVPFGSMKFGKNNVLLDDLASFDAKTLTQLEISDRSPIDGVTHFKVLLRPNSNVVTLQSLTSQSNMQALADMKLLDIEDRYSLDDYKENRPAFDAHKQDILGVTLEGKFFEEGIADERVLEEFNVVVTDGFVSFKSVATGGFISVNPSNKRLVTLDPTTMRKAGMDKAGVMVPTPRESFVVVPVSAYINKLGDILIEPNLTARLARYLYYVTGGISSADRKIFLDSISQEIGLITATRKSWDDYLADTNQQASLMAIMNQLNVDENYQAELKDEVQQVAAQLDAGYTGAGIGGIPAKGSIIVLQTMGVDGRYVKVLPSQFNPSIYVLGVGSDGGDDLFDPACQFVTDARAGKLGLKSSLANNKYVQSLVIDSVAGKQWISAKRNASTELSLTGTTFGTLANCQDQIFSMNVIDPETSIIQLKNEATGGYVSWVMGNSLPAEDKPISDGTTNAASFVSGLRLRTVDPLTLKPFGATTVNAADSVDFHGTQFSIIVFDEYYKMLMAAGSEKNYPARFEVYSRALPLIKSESELSILLKTLRRLVDKIRIDKEAPAWKDFSSEAVQPKFMALLDLIDNNFSTMLVDENKKTTSLGDLLFSLRNYEVTEAVSTYAMRFNAIQGYLDTFITTTCVADFMSDLSDFIADRADAVTIVPGTTTIPTSLKFDFMYTVTTWLSEHVLYNKVLASANKRPQVSALIDAAQKPMTYAEYVKYIDTRWVSGKDRFTINEKTYVLNHLKNLVAPAWLALGSAEDFDISVARDLLLRARANQFRDDKAAIETLNKTLTQFVYPLIPGATYLALMLTMKRALYGVDQASPAFTAAKDSLIKKAGLWKTRVILSGAGQLDLYSFATILNDMLVDPLLPAALTGALRSILTDVVSTLTAQGISFVVGGEASVDSSGITQPASIVNSSGVVSSGPQFSI